MVELFLGIVCGIALSLFFSFGPAFFSQLRTSIQYGYRKSYPFAFGVSAGDVLIVFLMLTVLKNVNLYEMLHNVWVASVSGVVLVIMGIYFMKKEVTSLENEEKHIKFKSKDGDPRRRTIFMQGFVINIVNPLIWIYWVSVVALLTGELNLSVVERYIYYVAVGTSNIVNALQPEMICFGGGISNEGETLLRPLREIVENERYTKYCDQQTEICKATLGNDAGIIGAALLNA